jgi:Rhodopsin-like GPCR transmembrane domain
MVLSSLVTVFLFLHMVLQISSKHSIHVALLWVAAASSLDVASSLFEIIHIKLYERNGIGSYWFDALSAHAEAACDSLMILLLLSIAAGWTLPLDMLSMNVNNNASAVQSLVADLAKPMAGLRRWNAGTVLGVSVLGFHIVLAQWGRTYNDDFESYHDLEHLPGQILMTVRVLLGFLCLAATMQTKWKCRGRQLEHFYLQLACVGFAWFQSLPVLVFLCNTFVPYYVRHPTVVMGSALLQSVALWTMAWLVTSHSGSFHQVSHLTSNSEPSLTDSLSNHAGGLDGKADVQSMWSIGKAKVRLD